MLSFRIVAALFALAGLLTQARASATSEDLNAEFAQTRSVDIGQAHLAYHQAGHGPALVMIHGFPLSGLTWRKLIPLLAQHYTCIALDVVGFGGSYSTNPEDFGSQGQARVFQQALKKIGVESYALLGNDSGGWLARELSFTEPPGKVTRLVLTNTEVPGHRPPWIPVYQSIVGLPGAALAFKKLLNNHSWRHSGAGFGGCFQDNALIDAEFGSNYLWPILASKERMRMAILFLNRMKFSRLDSFAILHHTLNIPVRLVWGDADPTFPRDEGEEMVMQFPNSRISFVPGGKLFMHEEYPEAVGKFVLDALQN